MMRILQVLAGTLLGLAVAGVLLLPREATTPTPSSPGSQAGNFLPAPLPAPDFTLVTHQGEEASFHELRKGRVAVLFFGFTHCPDICPATLAILSRAIEEVEDGPRRVQVIFVSVDPVRDTPERLTEYLSPFHPSFVGLTGTPEAVEDVADAYGVMALERETEGGGDHGSHAATGSGGGATSDGYTVDHTARAFVVNRDGEIPLTFPAGTGPSEMARDLRTLLDE